MADVLQAALGASPAGSAATTAGADDAKAKGARVKGKGKGEARDHRVDAIVPVLVSHERDIHDLYDRASFVVLVKDEGIQKSLMQLRDAWRVHGKKRRDEWFAAPDGTTLAAHAQGSQRSLLLAYIFAELFKVVPADQAEAKAATTKLKALAGVQWDVTIYRFKPMHQTPKEGRTWVWQALYTDAPNEAVRASVAYLYSLRLKEVGIAPSHSQDGPTIRWLKGKGKGKDKGKGDMDEENEGWGEEEELPGAKRGRGGRPRW